MLRMFHTFLLDFSTDTECQRLFWGLLYRSGSSKVPQAPSYVSVHITSSWWLCPISNPKVAQSLDLGWELCHWGDCGTLISQNNVHLDWIYVTKEGFLGSSDGKESSVMQDTRVRSLGLEDPLDKGMATHSSILAWIILWTEKTGRHKSMVPQKVGHNWTINIFTTKEGKKAIIFHKKGRNKCGFPVLSF